MQLQYCPPLEMVMKNLHGKEWSMGTIPPGKTLDLGWRLARHPNFSRFSNWNARWDHRSFTKVQCTKAPSVLMDYSHVPCLDYLKCK
ncbi:hypothetical protein VNO77_04446 [Canavalia gladiata]|uniref:Uncharacterized protein n=1 Tax=Canavalia gladiata TaxID=3824 RepID=A0AAN9MYJ9_CANGL